MRRAIKVLRILPIILGVIFTMAHCVFAEKYQLVSEGGKTEWRIVISDTASPSEKTAASELQKFLKEMSGAELPIVIDNTPISQHEIILGDNEHLRKLGVKIDFKKLGDEGCTIRTSGGHLIIAGSKKRGTLYGVWTFLEKYLGCRWFTDGVTRIPKVDKIEIGEINDTQIPALEFRMVSPGSYMNSVINKLNVDVCFFRSTEVGGLPEELGGNILSCEGHTLQMLLPPDKYFKDHPEYYAQVGAERKIVPAGPGGETYVGNTAVGMEPVQLCLTNPDVIKIVTENVKNRLRQMVLRNSDHKPVKIDIMSVSQMDASGASICQCPNCKAINEREGSPSGSIINFVNKVAEGTEKEFPDTQIITFAYVYSIDPPKTIKLRKNVIVFFCPYVFACDSHSIGECEKNIRFQKAIEGWEKVKGDGKIYVHHYASNFHNYFLLLPNIRALKPTIQYYVKHGVTGMYNKGDMPTPERILVAYLTGKLMWDPNYDVERGINEFMETYYGKAAPLMRQYFDMLEDKVQNAKLHFGCGARIEPAGFYLDGVSGDPRALFTAEVIGRAEKLFDEAEKLVAGDEEKLFRIQITRMSVWYFQMRTMTPADPKRKEIITKFINVADKLPGWRVSEWESMEEYVKKLKQNVVLPRTEGGG